MVVLIALLSVIGIVVDHSTDSDDKHHLPRRIQTPLAA